MLLKLLIQCAFVFIACARTPLQKSSILSNAFEAESLVKNYSKKSAVDKENNYGDKHDDNINVTTIKRAKKYYEKYEHYNLDSDIDCVLEDSEFYLSWWVHEDGSLKVSELNETDRQSGFIDLSFEYGTDETIYLQKILRMGSNNASDVIIFFSLHFKNA